MLSTQPANATGGHVIAGHSSRSGAILPRGWPKHVGKWRRWQPAVQVLCHAGVRTRFRPAVRQPPAWAISGAGDASAAALDASARAPPGAGHGTLAARLRSLESGIFGRPGAGATLAKAPMGFQQPHRPDPDVGHLRHRVDRWQTRNVERIVALAPRRRCRSLRIRFFFSATDRSENHIRGQFGPHRSPASQRYRSSSQCLRLPGAQWKPADERTFVFRRKNARLTARRAPSRPARKTNPARSDSPARPVWLLTHGRAIG